MQDIRLDTVDGGVKSRQPMLLNSKGLEIAQIEAIAAGESARKLITQHSLSCFKMVALELTTSMCPLIKREALRMTLSSYRPRLLAGSHLLDVSLIVDPKLHNKTDKLCYSLRLLKNLLQKSVRVADGSSNSLTSQQTTPSAEPRYISNSMASHYPKKVAAILEGLLATLLNDSFDEDEFLTALEDGMEAFLTSAREKSITSIEGREVRHLALKMELPRVLSMLFLAQSFKEAPTVSIENVSNIYVRCLVLGHLIIRLSCYK